jgi:hypothetical protein
VPQFFVGSAITLAARPNFRNSMSDVLPRRSGRLPWVGRRATHLTFFPEGSVGLYPYVRSEDRENCFLGPALVRWRTVVVLSSVLAVTNYR